jgi:RNA polymerase sigma-70 factor, ECF subfamily
MTLDPAIRDAMLAAIPKLRTFAISLCRNSDQADDLVQDALLRACAGIHTFKPGTNMCAWLFTILRNQFYSEWRRRQAHREFILDRAENIASSPPQAAQTIYGEFRRALTLLPEHQREAVVLVGALGLSYEEAAQVCRCPIGTIKSRINRARADLVRLLRMENGLDFAEDAVVAAAAAAGRARLGHPR